MHVQTAVKLQRRAVTRLVIWLSHDHISLVSPDALQLMSIDFGPDVRIVTPCAHLPSYKAYAIKMYHSAARANAWPADLLCSHLIKTEVRYPSPVELPST